MIITWRISDYIYTKLCFLIAHPCLKFTGSSIKDQCNQGIHILQRNIGMIIYLFWSSPIRFNWKIVSEKAAILSGSERVKFGVGWVTIKYINISVVTSISLSIYILSNIGLANLSLKSGAWGTIIKESALVSIMTWHRTGLSHYHYLNILNLFTDIYIAKPK